MKILLPFFRGALRFDGPLSRGIFNLLLLLGFVALMLPYLMLIENKHAQDLIIIEMFDARKNLLTQNKEQQMVRNALASQKTLAEVANAKKSKMITPSKDDYRIIEP